MKTKSFEIVKHNRIWTAAKSNGYSVKLRSSEHTKDLVVGETYELLVEDISIRSKYGTDVRYTVASEPIKDYVFFTHPKINIHLNEKLKSLGGLWDSEGLVWVLPAFVEDKVNDLEDLYNSELVSVEISAIDDLRYETCPCYFAGYKICAAFSRDSGVAVSTDVAHLSGHLDSVGSMKNWRTSISKGSTFRLSLPIKVLEDFFSLPIKALEDFGTARWNVTILQKN